MAFERIERGIYRQSDTPYLFIDWTGLDGKRHRESAKTKSLRKARKLRESRVTDAERGVAVAPEAKKVTLGDLFGLLRDDYHTQGHRSWDRVERAWRHIVEFFGGDKSKALSISMASLKKYAASRRADGKQPASIRYELALLRRAFNLAVEVKLLPTGLKVPKLAVDNTRTGFLSESDLGVLLLELPPYLRQPTLWAYVVGWRKEEVFGMRWDWIDEERGEITLPASISKNKKSRPVAYTAMQQLVDILGAQRALTDETERKPTSGAIPWVFHWNGKRIAYHYDAWRAACKRAGLATLRFHDLRRTAVRNMERAGLSRSAAMSLTGHVTESIYVRYAIVDESVQREALEKLAKSVNLPAAMPSAMP